MKNILLIALILTLSMGTAMAQQRGGGEGPSHRPNNPIERLTDQLGLDADQVVAITVIFEDAQALHEEEREAFQAVMNEIRENTHLQVLAVLTEEQQALYEELQQKREEFRRALEDARQENGYGGGRRMRNNDG